MLFNRLGKPDDASRERIIKRFDPLFPVVTESTTSASMPIYASCSAIWRRQASRPRCSRLSKWRRSVRSQPTRAWTAMPNYQGPVTPSQVEELTYAWHLAYVKTGWEEAREKADRRSVEDAVLDLQGREFVQRVRQLHAPVHDAEYWSGRRRRESRRHGIIVAILSRGNGGRRGHRRIRRNSSTKKAGYELSELA